MNTAVKKIIVKVTCLIVISFGLFLQIFSQSETFCAIGKLINFSQYTLVITINNIFYLLFLCVIVIYFREELSTISQNISIIKRSLLILAAILFISAVASVLSTIPLLKVIQPVKYNSLFSIISTIFLYIVLAPITEEFFFRKILISHFLQVYQYSKVKTVIFSSLLFYLPHFLNANTGLFILLLGLFCSIVFIYTSSVKLPILIHSSVNLLTMLFQSGHYLHLGIEYLNITVIISYLLMFLAFTVLIVSRKIKNPV